MAGWENNCSALLSVPPARPDDAPFVYVKINKGWRDLFIDLCAILDEGDIWAEGQDRDEGYTSALIAAVQLLRASERRPMDVGLVMAWLAPVAPDGWLILDGSEVNRFTYASLFDLWGVTFGAGDGVTTFNLPNLSDRMLYGVGVLALNQQGGSSVAYIDKVNMPNYDLDVTDPGHTHSITDPGHTHSITDPGHTHPVTVRDSTTSSTSIRAATAAGASFSASSGAQTTGISVNGNATGISLADNDTGLSVNSGGSNEPISIVPPVHGVFWIVWAGN